MRTLLSFLALLAVAASSAAAETPLDDALYVATQIAARETENGRTAITQDADSLRAEIFVRRNGGPREAVLWVSVTRVEGCKFEVSLATHYKRSLYSVDLAAADLAGAHMVKVRTSRGYLHPGIIIPGARFCHIGGRPTFEHIAAGTCVETFAVAPESVPRDDDKVLAAIHRLEKFCTAKLSLLSRVYGNPNP